MSFMLPRRANIWLCLILLICLRLGIFWMQGTPNNETFPPSNETFPPSNETFPQSIVGFLPDSQQPYVKILWLYWGDGLTHLESLAASNHPKYSADFACVKAWQALNPDWDIRVLDLHEASLLAPKFAILANDTSSGFNHCKLSNVLRLELLTKFGGVWSDTSNCPFKPLDDFVPRMLASSTGGFFMPLLGGRKFAGKLSGSALEQWSDCHKRNDDAVGARSGANWFMAAAQPNNIVFETWLNSLFQRMIAISKTKDPFPYFIAHCTFTQTRIHNPVVEAAWREFLKQPHYWASINRSDNGVCFHSEKRATGMSSEFARKHCFFIKKQRGEILEYVKSPEYMNFVKGMAQ